MSQSQSHNPIDWKTLLETTYQRCRRRTTGKNATYIPALQHVDPHLYAISIVTVDGQSFDRGDANHEVAIESVSKIFALALALENHGIATVQRRIGNAVSHDVFDSVVAIERSPQHALNSFDNGGAMATTSLSYVPDRRRFQKRIYDTLSTFANRRLHLSTPIYQSEYQHSDRNHALAYLLHSYGRFYAPVEPTVDVYTRQCSALVTSRDVATMAAVLANHGTHPATGRRIATSDHVAYILQHMQHHGLYESSQRFYQDVGYPAKSGVSGVLLLVLPGIAGIGIVSPPLDKHGNSVRGQCTAKVIANLLRKQQQTR